MRFGLRVFVVVNSDAQLSITFSLELLLGRKNKAEEALVAVMMAKLVDLDH